MKIIEKQPVLLSSLFHYSLTFEEQKLVLEDLLYEEMDFVLLKGTKSKRGGKLGEDGKLEESCLSPSKL